MTNEKQAYIKGVLIDKYGSISKASKELNVNTNTIYNYINGKSGVSKDIMKQLNNICEVVKDVVEDVVEDCDEFSVQHRGEPNWDEKLIVRMSSPLIIDIMFTPIGVSQKNWNLNSLIIKVKTNMTVESFDNLVGSNSYQLMPIDSDVPGGEIIPIRLFKEDGFIYLTIYNPGKKIFIRRGDVVAELVVV